MTDALTTPLTDTQRATLDIVLDLIVPPTPDGRMPGAAQVGVAGWLVSQAPDALPALRSELDQLDNLARERRGSAFASLDPAARQALVDGQRAANPGFLARLALETVTCYYQHDRVLQGLGQELRAPYPKGYQVLSGDLALLQPVRQRGKIYRDA